MRYMKINDLLTVDQAAALLKWLPQNIQYYCKPTCKQPIPHIQVGSHKLFERQKLLAWKKHLLDGRSSEGKAKLGWGETRAKERDEG